MKFIFTGKHTTVQDDVKARVEKKLGRLQKFFDGDTEVFVVIGKQKYMQTLEVTIPYNGVVFRSEIADEDIYRAIDSIIDILERQIRKNKTRLERRLRAGSAGAFTQFDEQAMLSESGEGETVEDEYNIIRTKRFEVKPMEVEEAILQMNMLGHEFFVFANPKNAINVVYKRKDGDYGLIEPEF